MSISISLGWRLRNEHDEHVDYSTILSVVYEASSTSSSGIRVNTLTLAGVWNNRGEDFLDAYYGRIPVRRMANGDDCHGAVIFLASPASRFVDGGWTAI